jgi:hypothetical protein
MYQELNAIQTSVAIMPDKIVKLETDAVIPLIAALNSKFIVQCGGWWSPKINHRAAKTATTKAQIRAS